MIQDKKPVDGYPEWIKSEGPPKQKELYKSTGHLPPDPTTKTSSIRWSEAEQLSTPDPIVGKLNNPWP
jgi:hypothetical protein